MKTWVQKTTIEEHKNIWKNYFFRLFLGVVSILVLNALFLALFYEFIMHIGKEYIEGISNIFNLILYILGFIAIISLLMYLFSYFSQLYFQLIKRQKRVEILTIKYIHKIKAKHQTRYILHTDDSYIDSDKTVIFELRTPFEYMFIGSQLICESIEGRSDLLSVELYDEKNAELNPEFSIHNNN